jgi:intracellular septation protein A
MTQTSHRAPATAAESPRLSLFLGLFWDIGLSLVAYYGLRAMGASPYVALLGGTVTAGLRIAYVWLRDRRLDGFAAFMLVEFGVGLGFALLSGDARFLVAKESFSTAIAGLIFLGSCCVGRPMVWHAAVRFQPAARPHLDRLWRTEPAFRRGFRVLTLGWGAGLLAEAAARVVVAYTLPVDAAAGLSQLLRFGTIGMLVLWTLVAAKRRRAGRP